ncbi:chondroitin AC/alginate lyase [Desarmillaria tabescens]|uniref:Chondroitin AC/alginate lyase n=1 Tax=Armillaria tabescens TaxID=1929756 RepID=A0AA39K0M3_ARMTA|nr:chondroitin AC/alginate lyase [Desarmillaria tabescens]KAK0451260.1 chondroitin AC/alginate lyase [Desarmillaria tabescens]
MFLFPGPAGPRSASYIPHKSLPSTVAVTMRLFLLVALGCVCRLVLAQVGPYYPVSFDLPFTKRYPREFVHPGLLHTADDFTRIKKYVFEEPTEPWVSAFANFSANRFAQSDYTMAGPASYVQRGSPSSSSWTWWQNDAQGAYYNALMWAITNDEAHARKGIEILTRWASVFTVVNGTDSQLAAGLQGQLFVNAAEILRYLGPMNTTDYASVTAMFFRAVAPALVPVGQANYGVAAIQTLASFAVALHDVTMWNSAMDRIQNDPCVGLPFLFHPETGQNVDSGRDQGHSQVGTAWLASMVKIIENQGFPEVWNMADNLLLKGYEYLARYNMGDDDVPYDPSWARCQAVLVNGPWTEISNASRGVQDGIFELPYAKYVVKMGLEAPWVTKAVMANRPEQGTADTPGFGTLLYNLRSSNST